MNMPVQLQQYPCDGKKSSALPLVLLHGWGNDSRVWDLLVPHLIHHLDVVVLDLPGFGKSPPCQTWQQTLEALVEVLPERFYLMGWSLGGMLAVQFAHRHPQRVEKLITLASNLSFVSRSGWRSAMPASVFDDFYQGFVSNPSASLTQFCGLQAKGDSSERALVRWFRGNSAEIFPLPWLWGLDWLKQLDNRETLAALSVKSLHLFGQNDCLVPSAAASKVNALSKNSTAKILGDVGHAPHISRPELVAANVLEFLSLAPSLSKPVAANPHQLQKQLIAESFSRAAAGYDAVADLQRMAGNHLMMQIPQDSQPADIADMGCGTGHFTGELAARFPQARCVGVDLSQGMLDYAASHHSQISSINWVCSDAEKLCMEDDHFDLVYSNFAFQWCQELTDLMAEQWRVLKPGGYLVFTTVGPQTLSQLRSAWQQADSYVHVNQFLPVEDVRSALKLQGFEITYWRREIHTRYHQQLNGLTGELKAIGAHNLNKGRNTGLTGRQQIAKMKSAYESFRTAKGLPADWELVYVVARKPAKLPVFDGTRTE